MARRRMRMRASAEARWGRVRAVFRPHELPDTDHVIRSTRPDTSWS